MNGTVCPEVSRSLPGAGLQRRSVLNDEECSGVKPDKRCKASQHAQKRKRGLRRNLRIVEGDRRGPQSDADCSDAQRACCCRLHFSRGGEEGRQVAEKIANACSQANKKERIAIAGILAQVCGQRDGEQAEPRADEERNSNARSQTKRKQRKKCRHGGSTESNAETQVWRGPEAQARSKQAEKNSPCGHRGHGSLQVCARYSQARQPPPKRALGTHEEVA